MAETSPYEVVFYERADGDSTIKDFLGELPSKVRAKTAKWIEQLEIHGPDLSRPYADIVRGKIRELRVQFGGMNYRFLYFFADRQIVLTHGFIKKTDKVPEEEIVRAWRFMTDFEQRQR